MARPPLPAALLLVGLALAPLRAEEDAAPAYPATRQVDAHDVLHGEVVPDPYRWLEDDDDPAVVAWDEAQQALLEAHLADVPGREALVERIEAELALGSGPSLPRHRGGWAWFTERRPGADHASLWRRRGEGDEGPPELVLDPDAWSEDGTVGMRGWWPSPDGRLVAYARDRHGSEATEVLVRVVETGEDLPEVLPRTKFTSLLWREDSGAFLYTPLPPPDAVPDGEAQYHRRIVMHRLGDLPVDDATVGWAGRPAIEWPYLFRSSDRRHAFAGRERPDDFWDTFALTFADGEPVLEALLVGHDSRTEFDRVADVFVLVTDHEAPRKRICTATPATVSSPEAWTTILPESEGVIEDVVLVGERVVVHRREDVVSRLDVIGLDGQDLGAIDLPGPGSLLDLEVRPDDTRLWLAFTAWDRPRTSYVCDLDAPGRPLETLAVEPTTLDVARMTTTRARVPSKDGTPVPVFLVHRRDVPVDGTAPTVLYGYGGFRVSMVPRFSRAVALWVDAGGVEVVACLRGGSEFGEAWHEAGSRGNKQNVFDDMIAVGDWLAETGRARRERLAIMGGSNGGLLVAAVANQRPDLCQAVVCQVPLTDMLRFHRFQYARAWTPEYGSPEEEEAFRWLAAYSPYHNVTDGAAYPAALVTAGLHDGRVDAFHARKIVARWQAATSSARPILLDIDRESGHGAASTHHRAEQLGRVHAFLRQQLGVPRER